jgi:polar amino acid transport system substrate-binding protein
MQKLWWSLVVLFLTSNVQAAALKFVTQDFSPFNYERDGVVSGPAAEIIRKVCAEIHLECSFQLLPWTRAQNDTKRGKAHGIFVVGWNEARAKWLHFSPPILYTEYGFFVRQDNPLQFKNAEDVKGYRVAVYGPSNTSKSLEKVKAQIGDLTIDMSPKDESAFHKLSLGRADAVYSNRDVGNYLIQKLGLTNLRYAGKQRALEYYIALSQHYVEKPLVDRFNAALVALYRRGEAQAILRQGGLTPTDLK